jgi:glycosyltransferase involved in cell wall biosynthesis
VSDVLVVESYYSGSHQTWADGFAAHSTNNVELLTLPGRFWKWRMFGGSLSLGRAARDSDPDVVLVSDMVDLPAFLGHARLGDVGTVLYMHENQLTYPLSPTARDDLAYAYMNWSSMVRADEVWFNSQFHLESVFSALPGFLRHFPDHRHSRLVDGVLGKSSVVPVGVDLSWVQHVDKTDPPLIVWNQRWEYDKDPVRLFGALDRLAATGVDFRLAICGENFRNVPVEFDDARTRLKKHIIQYGYADRGRYEHLLADSAVVISTAVHEFFGVGAVEAMACGAVPVFPDDLSYPELVPAPVHGDTLYADDDQLHRLLLRSVTDRSHRLRLQGVIRSAMNRYSWKIIASEYDTGLSRFAR